MKQNQTSYYLRLLWSHVFLLWVVCSISQSRQNMPIPPSVFLDCQINCHTIYVKQEIDFVNYVNDRQVADLYILATSQRAAAGTREIQLSFDGNGPFEGMT